MPRYARALLLLTVLWTPATVIAQEPRGTDLGGQLVANGEGERYLRVLQLLGQVPAHPVGIRPWTRHEVSRLAPTAAHPWEGRFAPLDTPGGPAASLHVLRPGVAAVFNSTAAQGEGEGPVWLGRGLNAYGSFGVRVRYGPLDLQVAPVAFWSQNADFELAPNGRTGVEAVLEPRYPNNIDAPQRFGMGSYALLDPGHSRLSLDTRFVTTGFSTSPLAWGPARNEPLVLGPNAGGFPHVFLGTGQPVFIGIGRLHAKFITGRLEQSEWSPVTRGDQSRLAAATVLTFAPAGLAGFEIGAIRFEHRKWSPGVVSFETVVRPFTSIFNDNTAGINTGAENGYASIFARWAIAPAGMEVYAEYGREDYTGSFRTLVTKPDDLGNLLVGFQRAWGTRADRVRVLRGELVNAELSHHERGDRGFTRPIPPYYHSGVRQGHTLNGQFLGSSMAYGGAGWNLALDRYARAGRTTWSLERRLVRDYLPFASSTTDRSPQVWYTAQFERLQQRDRIGDVGVTAGLTLELNHNTVHAKDRVMLQAGASWRAR